MAEDAFSDLPALVDDENEWESDSGTEDIPSDLPTLAEDGIEIESGVSPKDLADLSIFHEHALEPEEWDQEYLRSTGILPVAPTGVVINGQHINVAVSKSPAYASATLQGRLVRALIDSGAGPSLISYSLYKELVLKDPDIKMGIKSYSRNVSNANGGAMTTHGKIQLRINFDGTAMVIDFVIAEALSNDVIIGTTAMLLAKVQIDFKDKLLVFDNGRSVPLIFSDEPSLAASNVAADSPIDVISLETTTLHPNIMKCIMVKLDRRRDINSKYLMVDNARISVFDGCVGVVRGVIDATQDGFPVTLINKTQKSVEVLAGAVVASAVEAGIYDHAETAPQADRERPLYNWDTSSWKISEAQKAEAVALLHEFNDCFQDKLSPGGAIRGFEFRIGRKDDGPITSKPYRRPQKDNDVIRAHNDEMLKAGVIENSVSDYSTEVLLAAKKDGTLRFCIDYRKLNAATIKDEFPLPRIEDCIEVLKDAKYFSTMDGTSTFWQFSMSPLDRHMAAYRTQSGLYHPLVMSFGFKNAPSHCQRSMNKMFSGLMWKFLIVYLDDLVNFSKTFEDHMEAIRATLMRCRQFNLKLKPSKCKFFQTEVEYLGHIISAQGVSSDPKKIRAILNLAPPADVSQLKTFLGLVNYHKRQIDNLAGTAAPLYKLMCKDTKWEWSKECQRSFETLKRQLSSNPVMGYPDVNREFVLYTDMSNARIAGILSQADKDDVLRVIGFYSRSLLPAEVNYSASERECLALVDSIKHFKPYLVNAHFKAITDHQSLVWLGKQQNVGQRLTRWSIELQQYSFDVIYRKGTEHVNVDALSRLAVFKTGEHPLQVNGVCEEPQPTDFIRQEQLRDPELKLFFDYLDDKVDDKSFQSKVRDNCHRMKLIDDVLYRIWIPTNARYNKEPRLQLVLPNSYIRQALYECHDSLLTGGHNSYDRTYDKLRERFWFPNMHNTVKYYCETCEKCQRRKGAENKSHGLMEAGFIPSEPFEVISADHMGPIPRTERGNRYILVWTDHATRYIELRATKTASAEETAESLIEDVICRHGAPEVILTDQGKAFKNELMEAIAKQFKARKIFSSPYHPQCNGLSERINKVICDMLAIFCSKHQRDWDVLLPYVAFAIRTGVHSVTKYTPFRLLYSRDARYPLDIMLGKLHTEPIGDTAIYAQNMNSRFREALEGARLNTEAARAASQTHFNKSHRDVQYLVGDIVWLYVKQVTKTGRAKKLKMPWQGPYTIVAQKSPVTYKLRMKGNLTQSVHVSRLKPYKERLPTSIPNVPEDDTFDPEKETNVDATEDNFDGPHSAPSNLERDATPPTSKVSDKPVSTKREKKPVVRRRFSEGESLNEDDSGSGSDPEDGDTPNRDGEYLVTSITGAQLSFNKLQYQVQWSNGEVTWEPEIHLANCKPALDKFTAENRPLLLKLLLQQLHKQSASKKFGKVNFELRVRNLLGNASAFVQVAEARRRFEAATTTWGTLTVGRAEVQKWLDDFEATFKDLL